MPYRKPTKWTGKWMWKNCDPCTDVHTKHHIAFVASRWLKWEYVALLSFLNHAWFTICGNINWKYNLYYSPIFANLEWVRDLCWRCSLLLLAKSFKSWIVAGVHAFCKFICMRTDSSDLICVYLLVLLLFIADAHSASIIFRTMFVSSPFYGYSNVAILWSRDHISTGFHL